MIKWTTVKLAAASKHTLDIMHLANITRTWSQWTVATKPTECDRSHQYGTSERCCVGEDDGGTLRTSRCGLSSVDWFDQLTSPSDAVTDALNTCGSSAHQNQISSKNRLKLTSLLVDQWVHESKTSCVRPSVYHKPALYRNS